MKTVIKSDKSLPSSSRTNTQTDKNSKKLIYELGIARRLRILLKYCSYIYMGAYRSIIRQAFRM